MKCYEYNKKNKLSCKKEGCRYWMKCKEYSNCCINAASDDSESKFTLQDIGEFFNVTRMRICQIEKLAVKKLKEKIAAVWIEHKKKGPLALFYNSLLIYALLSRHS